MRMLIAAQATRCGGGYTCRAAPRIEGLFCPLRPPCSLQPVALT
jgi:hypothetical protein